MKTTLALCTIVKDEEAFIGQCLQSVQGVVDEIVLVDTGSTDRTVEIAEQYGAKVYTHPWQNSFSEARNYALQYVTAEWVLQLDADEVLEKEDRLLLHEAIENQAVNSYLLPIFNYLPEGMISKFYFRRLFRRKGARYVGRVHNQILVDGPAEVREIRIYHYGYNLSVEKMQAKYRRTEALIRQQIQDEPDEIFHRFNLVRLLRNKEAYEEAIAEGLRTLQMPNVKNRIGYYLMIVNDVCHSMLLSDRPQEIFPLCREALAMDPTNMDLLFALAGAHVLTGEYDKAITCYKKWIAAKKETNGRPKDVAMSIDTWNLDALVMENIAKCYKLDGDLESALAYFTRALQLDKKRLSSIKGKVLCYIESGRINHAIHLLEETVASGLADASVDYKLGSLYFQIGQFDKAIHYFNRYIEKEPQNAEVWNRKSVAELTLNRFDDARQSLQICLQLQPNHSGALVNQIKLLLVLGEDDALAEHINHLLEIKTMQTDILKELAELCMLNKKYSLAISLYEKYLLKNSADIDALQSLSTCYLLAGHLESARTGFESILSMAPNYLAAQKQLELLNSVEKQRA